MKLTAAGKYHFSSDIRNFKNIKLPPPPFSLSVYCIQFLRTSACVCRTSEKCKSLVLQGKCKIEIFLSPALGQGQTRNFAQYRLHHMTYVYFRNSTE